MLDWRCVSPIALCQLRYILFKSVSVAMGHESGITTAERQAWPHGAGRDDYGRLRPWRDVHSPSAAARGNIVDAGNCLTWPAGILPCCAINKRNSELATEFLQTAGACTAVLFP